MFNSLRKRPWMKNREIRVVEEILENLSPEKCLEWGAGYSTIYFPKFLKEDAKWITVEHDEKWSRKIRKICHNPKVEIFHVAADRFPWTDDHNDGSYEDLSGYIQFPSNYGDFDFVLIDGRARKACIIKAYNLLKEEGVVILHDANREHYHKPFGLYKHQVLFTDYRALLMKVMVNRFGGGVWIGSKGNELESLLNMDKHKESWRIYSELPNKLLPRRLT